jgi:hypothetical protein
MTEHVRPKRKSDGKFYRDVLDRIVKPALGHHERRQGSVSCRNETIGRQEHDECPLWVISGHVRRKRSCPLCPRKRTCALQQLMSAMGQKRTLMGLAIR